MVGRKGWGYRELDGVGNGKEEVVIRIARKAQVFRRVNSGLMCSTDGCRGSMDTR